jgi:hypothetical protein
MQETILMYFISLRRRAFKAIVFASDIVLHWTTNLLIFPDAWPQPLMNPSVIVT